VWLVPNQQLAFNLPQNFFNLQRTNFFSENLSLGKLQYKFLNLLGPKNGIFHLLDPSLN
jgi:hypothetical protein